MITIGSKKMVDGYVGNKKILTIYKGNDLVYQSLLPYLKFVSNDNFNLKHSSLLYDGTVEYSLDGSTWNDISSSILDITTTNKVIYLRGSGNSYCKCDPGFMQGLTFSRPVSCEGNVEGLLDYHTTTIGHHPSLGSNAFMNLFYGSTNLLNVPSLPSIRLSENCYQNMFAGCTGLTRLPKNMLLATTLSNGCYSSMFANCTNLMNDGLPLLPATTLAANCYSGMFANCSSLTDISDLVLPATVMSDSCYNEMFRNCANLSTIGYNLLPATTLANRCYYGMFYRCTSLTVLPSLPATELPESCYNSMFAGCTKICMSNVQRGVYTTSFRVPSSGTASTVGQYALLEMFHDTGGGIVEVSANTQYYYYGGTFAGYTFAGTNRASSGTQGTIPFDYSKDGGNTWTSVTTGSFNITGAKRLTFKLSGFVRNATLTSRSTGTVNLTTSASDTYVIYENETDVVITM